MEPKKALLKIILEKSFKYSKEPVFKLQSGKMSNYYIDLKQTTLNPDGIRLIGETIFQMIEEKGIQAVGGLTLGADPIAMGISLTASIKGKTIFPFIVRKEAKDHGTGKQIEAAFPFPADVMVLDDVITTGGSTIKALDACIKEGLNIKGVICIVNREEGGKEKIENDYKIPVYSLFTKTELFQSVQA
ncbi:MAG TPA: orotate phosphoribosyltransferase [Spirochaetia bacterium]|nr:orotate phosphoribosyltransferase [Spirochaetia bacterium]